MVVSIKVKGIEDVQAELKKKEKDIKNGMGNALIQVGGFMEGEVKSSIAGQRDEPTSVDTGRFLNSVMHSIAAESVTIFSDVYYAQFLEYGTSYMAARRHFNNSLDRNQKKVNEYFKDEISKEL